CDVTDIGRGETEKRESHDLLAALNPESAVKEQDRAARPPCGKIDVIREAVMIIVANGAHIMRCRCGPGAGSPPVSNDLGHRPTARCKHIIVRFNDWIRHSRPRHM